MLHQPDDVVLAHIHERRRRLLAEATTHRLARCAQPPAAAAPDRLLAALGGRLVQWGNYLQARSRRLHEALPGSYAIEQERG